MKLSLIVPAYNEEHRLGPMLDAYLPFFASRYDEAFELIVVVNGSTDRTAEVARARMDAWPMLRVLVDPRPIGKGGAILAGLRAARGEIVGYVDADGSTPPAAFEELVHTLEVADCVIADRWDPHSQIFPAQPRGRRIASRIFNLLVRLLFGLRLSDTQCGAKVLRREVCDRILPSLGLTRWAFDVDLLFQVHRRGYRIAEIPTEWHDKGGSHLSVWSGGLDMLIAIVRLRLLYSPFRWVVWVYDRTLGWWIHRPLPPPPAQLEVERTN